MSARVRVVTFEAISSALQTKRPPLKTTVRMVLIAPAAGQIQSRTPASHICRPNPNAAASVPFTMAMPRGTPPSRIGSVSAR